MVLKLPSVLATLAVAAVVSSCSGTTPRAVEAPGALETDRVSTTTTTSSMPAFDGLVIAAVGDWYDDDPEDGSFVEDARLTRDAIIDAGPDLVLGLGDFTYGNDPTSFFEFIKPLEEVATVLAAFGNHDGINTGEVRRPRFYRQMVEHFGQGEFFTIDFGPIRFLSINGEFTMDYERHEEQLALVTAALESALADPGIAMVIPFFHKSMVYPVGKLGPTYVLQEIYLPLLEQHSAKIPLALQGHHHIYARTDMVRQLPGRDDTVCREDGAYIVCQVEYEVVDGGKGHAPAVYSSPEGIVFLTVGSGGARANGLTTETAYMAFRHKPESSTTATDDGTFGFLLLSIAHDATAIEGEFRANNGEVLDWFKIELP